MAIKSITDAFDTLYRIEYIGLPVNTLWNQNILRWRYLIDSFNGGNDYRRGEYLTKYVLEDTGEYQQRIANTALDNHVKSVVDTYNAFLFRKPAYREYGSIENDPALTPFLEDADLEGRSFDAFMRDVSTMSSVYGHVWCLVDRPESQAGTRAEELSQGIRPYVSMFTPENVLNWEYERQPNGLYTLSMIQILESIYDEHATYREYTPDYFRLVRRGKDQDPEILDEKANPLGQVPCVPVYAQRSVYRGIGVSDVADIADTQRSIANELSELEQLIRLQNHPSLVMTAGTDAQAGAGAIITMEEGVDPGLKPYLLQPNGASIESLLKSIEHKVDSINRMANMGGVRNTVTRAMSGVALETEFQLLNSRLSAKADHLELAEEQIWRLWANWQGQTWDGQIDYPNSFNLHDRSNTVALVQEAKKSMPQNPRLLEELDRMLARALIDDEDVLAEIMEDQRNSVAVPEGTEQSTGSASPEEMTHPVQSTASGLVEHLKEMIAQGYTTEQILELHPEIEQLFNQNQ